MSSGNCSYKFGYVGVDLTQFTAVGYLQIQQDWWCVSPCAEPQQAALLSDILWGIPAVKIEQELCGIDQNSQRGVPAFLSCRERVSNIDWRRDLYHWGGCFRDFGDFFCFTGRKHWWFWASFGGRVDGSFVSLLLYSFWSRLILLKIFSRFSDCQCWWSNWSLWRCGMILSLVNQQFWKYPFEVRE